MKTCVGADIIRLREREVKKVNLLREAIDNRPYGKCEKWNNTPPYPPLRGGGSCFKIGFIY